MTNKLVPTRKEVRFPQKVTQQAKCWPIPDDLKTSTEILEELNKEIPELDKLCTDKNIKITIHSLDNLRKYADNYLFKEMWEYNKQGISVIFIIDIFWYYQREITMNVIKYRLNIMENMIKIGARQIEIKEVTAKDAREFSTKYSAHGFRASTIKLGAYYKGELVSLMTFGKPFLSYNKYNVDYECYRHCGKPNIQIIGLIDKMLKYLYTNYGALNILNYKENLHFNDSNAPNKPGYIGEIGVTTYYIINNVLYPRIQAMNMRDRLSLPIACYDKISTPGSAIYIMNTIKLEDMF